MKGSFSLKCTLDEPVAGEIAWFKNETNLKEKVDLQERLAIVTSPDNKESVLTLSKAQNGDAGEYSCRWHEHRVDYNVIANVVVKLPSNAGVVEGEKLKLVCTAVGTKVIIRWTLPDNTTIDGNDEIKDGRIRLADDSGNKNSVLIITGVLKSDHGPYVCEGRHMGGVSDQVAISETVVRVKDKFAALWPFIGICSEVFILCAIILIYEKRRTKNVDLDESDTDVAGVDQKNDNHKDVRQRK